MRYKKKKHYIEDWGEKPYCMRNVEPENLTRAVHLTTCLLCLYMIEKERKANEHANK